MQVSCLWSTHFELVPKVNHICFLSRIKSRDNRDKRVELLQKYARSQFPAVKYMEYAVTVETYTLTKANNLVMNVDGCIGSLFLDLLSSCAMFTQQEIDEIIEIGYLNGLFVLARSIGLIGYVSTSINLILSIILFNVCEPYVGLHWSLFVIGHLYLTGQLYGKAF